MQFKCNLIIFLCIKINPFDVECLYIPMWVISLHP
jgi:hypothetical protein